MKNRWKTFYKAAALSVALLGAFGASASEPTEAERIEALDNLSFIEMINSVEINNKQASELIQKFQAKEGNNRLRNGKYNSKSPCNVETYRNKEVLLLTIPASVLFAPNSTELSDEAAQYLEPIKRYLRQPDMYRVLLTMHTDNTGSQQYRDDLTVDRVDAVFDWFENSGVDTRYLFTYAFGDEMPLKPNDSMENRAANRRLEIYLVPGEKMVQQAKKGRIAF